MPFGNFPCEFSLSYLLGIIIFKVEKFRIQKEEGGESPKDAEVKAHSPPVVELFSQVTELAREIVQEGSMQYGALLAGSVTEDDVQKVDDASLQKEYENLSRLLRKNIIRLMKACLRLLEKTLLFKIRELKKILRN